MDLATALRFGDILKDARDNEIRMFIVYQNHKDDPNIWSVNDMDKLDDVGPSILMHEYWTRLDD